MSARPAWILAGILAALLLVSQCASHGALADRDARVDSLRSEALAARLVADGWETRWAVTEEVLVGRLLSLQDSTALLGREKAALAEQVELLGGRLALVTDLYASVRGQLVAHDAVVHGADDYDQSADSITAEVDDGLLSGRLVYVPPSTLGINPYSVALELVLGIAETPDGRALATARAADPRVSLRYGDVYWSPPPPVQVCSLGTRLEWGAWGAALGVVGGVVAVSVGGGA